MFDGWIIHPAMEHRDTAAVAVFTALIIGSDFALYPLPNVKLLDMAVFVAAFVFGPKVGTAVAVLSETTWGFVSPAGSAGAILPFLVAGELLFVLAGYVASRWGGPGGVAVVSTRNLFFGGLLAMCAFIWDFETNIATGLLGGARTVPALLAYEILGIPFMILHEFSDFLLGALVAPPVIVYAWRTLARSSDAVGMARKGRIQPAGGR